MPILIIILVAIGLLVLWLIATFNRLIRLRHQTDEAWSDIDVQMKRRHDLIPNLIETVKGYAKQEKDVFESVTKARTAAMQASGAHNQAQAENMLSETLKSLFAVSENYPDLKSSENFLELQKELRDAEDKIASARRFYNGNVRDINIAIDVFPTNVVAGMLGFKKREFFDAPDEVNEVPQVAF